MNSFARPIALLTLGGLLTAGLTSVAMAQTLPNSTPNSSNPQNSPVHRANPNSRQGTVPSTPPVRGPSSAPKPQQPSLENGGIGNGYPTRQQPPQPNSNTSGQNRKNTD
jgi:hypothetical protein